MTFSEIEDRRKTAGITQVSLCERAGIHPTTYSRRRRGSAGMREVSLNRLAEALDRLIEEGAGHD